MDPTKCGTYHKSTQSHQFLMHGDSPHSQSLDFVSDGTLDFDVSCNLSDSFSRKPSKPPVGLKIETRVKNVNFLYNVL